MISANCTVSVGNQDGGIIKLSPSAITTDAIDPDRPTRARLLHESSDRNLWLATDIFFWRIGKPHQGTCPNLDVSGFPHAEIVSRHHAMIRYRRGQYYIEDTNSANGTYVNRQWLTPGRHYPLNHEDCIALGKGDLMRFFFQICGVA